MPEPHRQSDRTAAARQADHASLVHISEGLVPALVARLQASGLGELEVREGDWKVRVRRPATTGSAVRRAERARPAVHGPAAPAAARAAEPVRTSDRERGVATSPAVGVFRAIAAAGARVRQGDRIGTVDLLGIPQDVVAPIDGTLVELFIETGDAVEYGEEIAAVEAPAPLPEPGAEGDEVTPA